MNSPDPITRLNAALEGRYRIVGEAVWDRFSASKDETLWYYRELGIAYRSGGAEGFLVEEFERTVVELEQRAKMTQAAR